MGTGTELFPKRECDSATGRATAATQGNRARYCLRSHRKQGDRPLNPVVECVLGVPGKGRIPEGVAAGRVARGALGDLAGIPWVDYVATKAPRTSGEGGARVPGAAPLRQPDGVPPRVPRTAAPADSAPPNPARRWLRQTTAPPVYRTSARTREGTAPLSSGSLRLAVRVRGGEEPGTLLAPIHSHSTSQGGEGPPQGGTRLQAFSRPVRRHL